MKNVTIWDYVQSGKIQDLENDVRNQLPQPFDFEARIYNLPKINVLAYFMPCFKVFYKFDENSSLENIISLISPEFEVVDATVLNGEACIECIAHEGPYAETIPQILHNIEYYLSPYILRTLVELKLDFVRLQFLIDEML
ncbi:hypothetical protein SAMN03159341_12260 [Paenibacillus sp. 1_12]|uniref:hypothetical protein n=1 Tax=Paenibacillus sp. 1_12 TaxID=1566278 RepID=UPI0008F180A5|nr:hypothetical protein [Paenibacillus sp. 1_12]SFM25300.1 hypothetical protein SAMN03159341_12260 [Paenibacillus sp. 1_12]